MERVTFIIIDQVRSNIQIESPWAKASNEKSVGTFGNYKSATAVAAFQHNVRQWIFLSRGASIKPSDPMQVDGWTLNFFTEKNKLAPSQYSVPLVFDKKWGIISFYSEYVFLKEKTKTERKYWPTKNLVYPFAINTSGNSRVLTVIDPTSNSVLYESPKIMESKILDVYNTNQEFHYWFDKAVEISVEQRINIALFRNNPVAIECHSITSDIINPTPPPISNPGSFFQTELAQIEIEGLDSDLEDGLEDNSEGDDELSHVDFS